MHSAGNDKVFAGSIPRIYEQHLVPMLFAPYAEDLTRRVAARSPGSVLEIAAGTGVVTRAMARSLPAHVPIVATDLNEPMLHQASMLRTTRPVEWRQADATKLPFDDGSFDAVVCQFGVMFFPDKPEAFSEVRRVLRPGATFLFNVWDRLETNEVPRLISEAVASLFPANPPRFLERTPHAYFDHDTIRRDLRAGGFARSPELVTLTQQSRTRSAREAAIAFCQGTPLRNEIEERDPAGLERVTEAVAAAIAERFGGGAIDATMQAIVVSVTR